MSTISFMSMPLQNHDETTESNMGSEVGRLLQNQPINRGALISLLKRDAWLVDRVLQLANHKAVRRFGSEHDSQLLTTVDEAARHIDTDLTLLIALNKPLSVAVSNTCEIMFNTVVESGFGALHDVIDEPHLKSAVRFSGLINGAVQVCLNRPLAYEITTRIVRVSPAELGDADVTDVIGELTNMITGNFISSVCRDVGASSLSTPTLAWSENSSPLRPPHGASERLECSWRDATMFVDSSIEPSTTTNPS